MIKVTEQDITLGCRAETREEALRQAATILQMRGLVTAEFVDALLAREASLSTWIGAGVAMPHSARKDAATIIETGYHLLQFPDGVKWERGRIAFLVVVVAARENEHIDVLAGLADLLGDERQSRVLAAATDKPAFLAAL